MNGRMPKLLFLAFLVSACDVAQPTAPEPDVQFAWTGPSYVVDETIVLDFPDGGGSAVPRAINSIDQIVGWAKYPGSDLTKAVLWQGGNLVSLHRAGWIESGAEDINDAGDIVGWYRTPTESGAFLLRGRQFVELNLPPGAFGGRSSSPKALAINESGEVVGVVRWTWQNAPNHFNFETVALRWQTKPTVTYDPFPEVLRETATDVNDLSLVVGGMHYFAGTTWKWLSGKGICYSPSLEPDNSRSINNNNWIVGSTKVGGVCRAARFQSYSPPALLSGTSSTSLSHAHDVSDEDLIVGVHALKPVFWPPSGPATDLPTGFFIGGAAMGINEKREIVGWVSSGGAVQVPILWRLRKDPGEQGPTRRP